MQMMLLKTLQTLRHGCFSPKFMLCSSYNATSMLSVPSSSWNLQHSRSKTDGMVRIGCASGFWGDTSTAAMQLVKSDINYLVFDYLSEITMSLLMAAKAKKSDMGYAPDFVHFAMKPILRDLAEQKVKVISNAGGINPLKCAEALAEVAEKSGCRFKIATVTGDDLQNYQKQLASSPSASNFPKRFASVNAYLGAGPIAKALDLGADIVITGRCVDSALALGPLVHEFDWSAVDYDKLASGSLAGHLIECGAQVTGGIFTDWESAMARDWANIGFPIVQCKKNGEFNVTKPAKTGGQVSFGTVAEQLVYEIGDPDRYELPDVVSNFSDVHLQEDKNHKDLVHVSNVKGLAPSKNYKVCGTYVNGFKATAVTPVIGPKAAIKALRSAEAILTKTRLIFKHLSFSDYTKTHAQFIGNGSSYGQEKVNAECNEGVLWLSAMHKQREALEVFAREIAPAGTGMSPGLTTLVGGRPRISPVLRLFSFQYPKSEVPVQIHMDGELVETYKAPEPQLLKSSIPVKKSTSGQPAAASPMLKTGQNSYRLQELAYTRSGDKGDTCNIGVIARDQRFLPYLRQHLTEERVGQYFAHFFEDEPKVKRHELPGIGALNFVLEDSLGGGGVSSLRPDPQGKAYGQMLLDLELTDMPSLQEILY